MQVHVSTDEHIHGGESLVQWVRDEAQSRLLRFQDHVPRLEVYLSDVDAGKSGANDKRCRLEARVNGRQPLSVMGDGDKMASAFTSAVDKLIRALDADLGRAKDRHARDTIRTADPAEEPEIGSESA